MTQTARTPSASARTQWRRVANFVHWMNEERRNQGIGMRGPCEMYASSREWRERPDEVEYPGSWEVRRVQQGCEIQFKGAHLFLSTALAGETVGLI